MKHRQTLKKAMAYVYMPLLFCLLIYGILYVTLAPLVGPLIGSMSLFTTSSLADSSSLSSIFNNTPPSQLPVDTVNESDVEMPTYGTHYANLSIDSAQIEADLYFGDSDAVLKQGVGQYIGSAPPGHGKPLLIGGHNNAAFHRLQYVQVGDVVTITTNYGVYEYTVTQTRIVNTGDETAYDLSQDKEQLILYTCYPFDTLGLTAQRYIVYADKTAGPVIVSSEEVTS